MLVGFQSSENMFCTFSLPSKVQTLNKKSNLSVVQGIFLWVVVVVVHLIF